jgi:hypothetical protein
MESGIPRRNYGAAATPELLMACARRAEAAGLNHIWSMYVTDDMA